MECPYWNTAAIAMTRDNLARVIPARDVTPAKTLEIAMRLRIILRYARPNRPKEKQTRTKARGGCEESGLSIIDYLRTSAEVIEKSATSEIAEASEKAIVWMTEAAGNNAPILVCGNGGSAADAMHITGELVGRFLKERKALNCICLSANPAILTAWSNDYEYETVFSRQVEAHGAAGGVVIGLSTSGNSANVVNAFTEARRAGMKTIGLTGEGGGRMAEHSDALIAVPSKSTPLIQQVHICLYHYLCEQVEARVFADAS